MRSFHQFLLEMDGQAVPTTGDVTNVMQKFVQIASADHAKLDFNGNDLLQVGKAFQLKVIYLTAQQIMRMAQSVASAPKSGWGGDEEEYDFDHPTGISQMKPLPGLTAIINNLSMNPTLARKFQKALAGFKQHVDYYLKINKDPSQLNQQQVMAGLNLDLNTPDSITTKIAQQTVGA